MRILVVDDVAVLREVLRAVALSVFEGSDVQTAVSIADGLAVGRALPSVDLVLLDFGLPDAQGLDGLARFRSAFPKAKIIVTSSQDDDALVSEVLDAGANGFLPKSSNAAVIFAALRALALGQIYQPGAFARVKRTHA